MIIFLANGQLGNQLFQYAFLKKIQKNNERIIVFGFEELQEVFEIDDIINFNSKNRWIKYFLYSVFKPTLYFFSHTKIVSSIEVSYGQVLDIYRRESTEYTKKKGIFNFITFVNAGFFQSETFFDNYIARQLVIKYKYIESANSFLTLTPESTYKVFIHIRRGDYNNHTVFGKSTLLPMSYFKNK